MSVTIDQLQAQINQLLSEQALQTQALRRILEGNLSGATGAAADVVALEGGNTTIDVQLGKSSGA